VRTVLCVGVCAVLIIAGCIQSSGGPARDVASSATAENDFITDARLVYLLAACAGDVPPETQINAKVVRKHCEEFRPRLRKYVNQYVNVMRPFIAGQIPSPLPSTVVYPFGGGDLVTALITYPEASEIYTLSLEHTGDVRTIHELGTIKASRGFSILRQVSAGLLDVFEPHTPTINTNGELISLQEGSFPNLLTLFLVGLAVHGQEPVSLRYFTLDPDGDIRYLDAGDIAAMKSLAAKPLAAAWKAPDFSAAFSNSELRFKPIGKAGPIRVHRHIAANLANEYFNQTSPLFKHLSKRGKVAAMIKGGLNLLWDGEFSHLQDYLVSHMDFMISDCSGLSPLQAPASKFAYRTFGRYEGILPPDKMNAHERALLELFHRQPYRPLPARYGYPDKKSNSSMIFMERTRQ